MEHPVFAEVVKTKTYTCDRLKRTWTNTNKLLDKGYLGCKTGNTSSAGPCLSSCVRLRCPKYPEHVLVGVVVLDVENAEARFKEVSKLV